MIYDLSKLIDCQRAEKRFKEFLAQRTKIVLTKKAKRTLQQNSYLHLIIGYFAAETGYTAIEAKQIFKEQSPQIFEYEKYDGIENKNRKFIRSSSELTTTEMTIAIEKFRNYSSMEACVYLPEPREKEFLAECEIEMQKNRYI